MMALDISLPFPGLFSAWAGSAKRYWVTLAKRRRAVPIVNANDGFRVIGFAKVFLPMNQDQNGNKSLCAEYVGPYYLLGSDDNGNTGMATPVPDPGSLR